mgnify:CR=1 FL=1
MKHKELKVKLQHNINLYLHHALPLCVITADEKLIPWFYEHFIEIFSRTFDNGYVSGNYLEYWAPFRVLCEEEVHMGIAFMAQVKDIVEYVVEKIDMDYYVSINLDEYYIPSMRAYKEKHDISSALIYGYDNNKNHLLAIGFDQNMTFTKMIFNYVDFTLAYGSVKMYYKDSAPWCETEVIDLLKLSNFKTSYPFSLSRFLPKLYNYIYSVRDDAIAFSRMQLGNDSSFKYGLDVYDDLIDHLEGKKESDYKLIHLLYESKKAIYDRLQYIIENVCLTERFESDINRYSDVVKRMGMSRMGYLKIQEQIEMGRKCTADKEKMISALKETKNEEKQLLSSIYNELKATGGGLL